MIHHVSLEVSDLGVGGSFYDAVLGALGWRRHVEEESRIGWEYGATYYSAYLLDPDRNRIEIAVGPS